MVFHKYPKIFALGHEENQDIFKADDDEIVIEEKCDGANTRWMIAPDDGRIIWGSRGTELGYDTEVIDGNWKRCTEFIKSKVLENGVRKIRPGLIYFGECMVKHSVDYDWAKIPPVLCFDIMDMETGKFLDYKEKCDEFNRLGLPIVPLYKITTAKEIKALKVDDSFVPPKAYGVGRAEGVVFKCYSKQLFGKYVTNDFKEVNKAVFGGGKKYAKDETEWVVCKYCTNPRIDKCVFKLVDSGKKLEMALMQELPKMVYDDIFEEAGKEIFESKKTIDFQSFKKQVGTRCIAVLKQLMVNNALNK